MDRIQKREKQTEKEWRVENICHNSFIDIEKVRKTKLTNYLRNINTRGVELSKYN
jgi:hypothetical protein